MGRCMEAWYTRALQMVIPSASIQTIEAGRFRSRAQKVQKIMIEEDMPLLFRMWTTVERIRAFQNITTFGDAKDWRSKSSGSSGTPSRTIHERTALDMPCCAVTTRPTPAGSLSRTRGASGRMVAAWSISDMPAAMMTRISHS